jgi:CDK5 regulatory subunit-associated protein 2
LFAMDETRDSNISKTQMDLIDSSSNEPFGLTLPPEDESMHPTGIHSKGFCVKEYEEQMQELKKENFNLKLKIFMLEDKNPNIPEGAEALYKQNIDLKVGCYEDFGI